MHTTYITDEACERDQHQQLNPLDVPTVAPTCPSCDGHNVTTADLGACRDCGMTDNLSAFMGGGMTPKARINPSKFGRGGAGTARKVRAFTISGNVD
jgi:hypothetical protein